MAITRLDRVLVSTDLSPVGNSILAWAYGLVAPGGRVHLLHVIEDHGVPNPLYAHYQPGSFPKPEEREAREADIESRLRALVPSEAAGSNIETLCEILRDDSVADAIVAAAERLDVEAVCMATHGRSGISALVAGSVAREVAASSKRPLLLLLRPPPDA
jgi:nucleotide-binding universal stress UspA family protein